MNLPQSDLKTIKRRIKLSEKYYEKELKTKFERALELYTGMHYDNLSSPSKQARIIVNYILHIIESKISSIAFRYPQFIVNPLTSEGENTEYVAQTAVQYFWRKGHIQREMRRAWKDREIYGLGVVYTGWLFETEEGLCIEDGRMPVEGEEEDTTPNPVDENEDQTPVPQQVVTEDRFLAKRICPKSFFVNPECGRLIEEAEYCGWWELRPIEEVKRNSNFSNTRKLKGTTDNLRPWFDAQFSSEIDSGEDAPSDVKRVKLFHYFEKRRKIHVVMTDEHDKALLVKKWDWEKRQYPFRIRQSAGDEDEFYGIPTPILIEHPQRELNEARSQLSDYRRTAVPKYQAAGGFLTDKAKKQIKSVDPGVIVEHNGSEPATIVPIQQQSIQAEVYSTEEKVLADFQNLAAVNQYALGNIPSKRIPTAEVNAITNQGGARSQNDQQEFETWCAEVALDCLDWLKMYSVKTRELPIYDDNNKVIGWHDFTGDQIRGDYDIEVFVGSTTAPNNADNIKSIAFFVQSIAPLIQMAPIAQQSGINLMPLVKQLLKNIPTITDVDEIMQGLQNEGNMQPEMNQEGMQPEEAMQMGGQPQEGQLQQLQQLGSSLPPELLQGLQ